MTRTVAGIQVYELMVFLLAACGSWGAHSSQKGLRTRVRGKMLKHR